MAAAQGSEALMWKPDAARAARGVPLLRAMLAQIAAALLLAAYLHLVDKPSLSPLAIQAIAAAAFGQALRLPCWWLPINAASVPGVVAVRSLVIAPVWFLAAFCLLLVIFWNTYRTRVPLYLSSRSACARLAQLLPSDASVRVLDLGCGFGGVIRALRQLRPRAEIIGLESAPLPSWVAKLRLRGDALSLVERRNFWDEDLVRYDVVYAFLSPEPMERLWRKVRSQMRPNTLFVSNTFAVPDVAPDLTLPLSPNGTRVLYVWRIRG
jgi:SAM-dependent methyltransferase